VLARQNVAQEPFGADMRQCAAAALAFVVGFVYGPGASAQTAPANQSGTPSVANDDVNTANNPPTPKATVYIQNYFIPDITDAESRSANQFLLRGVIPSDAFREPQLLWFKLSTETVPAFPTGADTGLGDLTLYDLFLLPTKAVNIGIGP